MVVIDKNSKINFVKNMCTKVLVFPNFLEIMTCTQTLSIFNY